MDFRCYTEKKQKKEEITKNVITEKVKNEDNNENEMCLRVNKVYNVINKIKKKKVQILFDFINNSISFRIKWIYSVFNGHQR